MSPVALPRDDKTMTSDLSINLLAYLSIYTFILLLNRLFVYLLSVDSVLAGIFVLAKR